MPTSPASTGWRIVVTPDQLSRYREDERFITLVTLGRAANILRTLLAIGLDQGSKEGTGAERNRSALLLLSAGMLFEIHKLLETLGRHFRHLEAFKRFVAPLLADTDFKSLMRSYFDPVRNKVSFHNDLEVSAEGLKLTAEVEHTFARSTSNTFTDTYFGLSDLVAYLFLFADRNADSVETDALERAGGATIRLSGNTCLACDKLIIDALQELGFEPVEE